MWPPSAGLNPTVWPFPQDRILWCGPPPLDRIIRCGPSRRIDSLGNRKGQGHGQGLGLGQGQGLDFLWWPIPGDRTGPSRRIGLSAMAPPGGFDFPLWPLPGDWTFRCGPSRGIGLSDVAPPAGSNPTVWPSPRDRLPHRGIVRKFFESMLLHLKGQSTKNVCMVEQYYPRLIIFML